MAEGSNTGLYYRNLLDGGHNIKQNDNIKKKNLRQTGSKKVEWTEMAQDQDNGVNC
jgi:hypothetical protein